jgi:hypothetical protein
MRLSLFEGPRKHPLGVTLTHVPLLLVWVAFAVSDLRDGRLKLRRGPEVDVALDPAKFYFCAGLILAVALFVAARAVYAMAILMERDQENGL